LKGKKEMARRKYKITGCAKFFLILLILAPLAYVGASYFNGQDGIQNLKNLLGFGNETNSNNISVSTTDEASENEIYQLNREVERLKKEVEVYESENTRLKRELNDCQDAKSE
jgi:cell division protein FtsL